MADTTFENAADGHKTNLDGDEAFGATSDPGGTPVDVYITPDDIANNYLYRYKLSVTVSSNDLTVAIKHLNGNNPSSSAPLRVRVGDTEHTLTSALSVTAAAATNWCNSGSAELATKAVGYFVYLGYDATDGVVIGFSRIPWATTYSDFSATSTNEKYAKISTTTNASAGDEYENIGYFEATLSAGAGYTWSSPGNVISKPRYETDWLDWVPSPTGDGTITYTSVSVTFARYKIGMNYLHWHMKSSGTLGGSASAQLEFNFPFDLAQMASVPAVGYGNLGGTNTGVATLYSEAGTPDKAIVRKGDYTNFTASGTQVLNLLGKYET